MEKEAVPFCTRVLALHALVNYNKIREGGKTGLNDFVYGKLVEAAHDLKTNVKPKLTCIQNTQGTKLSKILADVDKILATQKVDVLVVDYIGAVGNETVTPNRPDLDDARTSQRLQAYGKSKKLVVITAAQLKTQSAQKAREKNKKDDAKDVGVGTEDISGSKMIIADADCALGVFLNADDPPTKMRVNFIKARESQSRQTIELDFDGAIYRVSDPVLHDGQITSVQEISNNPEINNIIYNKTVEELKNDDDLFGDKSELNDKDAPKASPVLSCEINSLENSSPVITKPVETTDTPFEKKEMDDFFEV